MREAITLAAASMVYHCKSFRWNHAVAFALLASPAFFAFHEF